ncbi:glycosyltransferase (GT2) [Formosa agariphila KMM 3901]|uniref:Glycosyltransferase (GT2) n=1 Tax=Formosa agariphila (strain DSM 15362 / KCTC 12365 / LMG 23005 / KMM 3901 / M-2Alg 35-1) TaxID=1347342 RepID=T2KSD3_FORAG|nr:glycosyltransferase [Formosa agariphila]CDF81219.1 glycosyltransferase (GT2) [Formosa agariphila KMM 3901]
MNSKMKVTVVTVTYGNRFTFLKEVIDSSLSQLVDEIIIVSNGSDEYSINQIRNLVAVNTSIKLIDLKENTGSANGFYQGLNEAYNTGAEFIWILDDDNKPKANALSELKLFWQSNTNLKKNNTALLSYRLDRELYKKAIQSKDPFKMLGSQNSFLGFNILDKFSQKETTPLDTSINYGEVSVAPYGGLFFHRKLIDTIGLPDINYYLYGDDYDYSYRISKNKGKIYLVLSSVLEDLEKSFHLKSSQKRLLSNRFIKTDSKNKIFYAVRNGIKFEQNFVDNKVVYILNAIIYLVLTFVILLFNYKHFWKLKYVLKGVMASIK